MAIHDTLGDFLTVIRNASRAGRETCNVPFTKMRLGIAKILQEEGLIVGADASTDSKGRKILLIKLKYVEGVAVITDIQRHSKPGRRLYYAYRDIPRVLNGLGTAILSTSKGILKDVDARRQKIGGELICTVW